MEKKLPRLSRDDIAHKLKLYPVDELEPAWFPPAVLRKLFEAAARHDADTFELTREEAARGLKRGTTPRYEPISPFLTVLVLAGLRCEEACILDFRTHVLLDSVDYEGNEVGELRLRPQETKGKKKRSIYFDVSPALRDLIAALRRKTGGKGSVFGITLYQARTALDRLRDEYGAPDGFDWQALRSNCDSYLNCSPGIYRTGVAAFRASKQIGHSVKVSEDHYTNVIPGIKPEHRTLEAAMQIESEVRAVIARVSTGNTQDNVVRLAR